ncbi:hypothetical protein KPH14_008716 [Odynerus spinipes]|uniref:Serine/arginine-rich splicing factor 2 n=1 Tax=Odynerus spinipes TaxID=1348599 RepID=A0AAD9VHN1_9HYME|nr:hypothetical protein KPH14_008716 [Odynerus spinipes]
MSYGRPPPRIDGMVSLKVDNLTYRTTPEDLRRVFERCGEVGDIYIPRDRFTRESRGFAFVRFYDKRDAEDALDAMDGRLLDDVEGHVAAAEIADALVQDHVVDRAVAIEIADVLTVAAVVAPVLTVKAHVGNLAPAASLKKGKKIVVLNQDKTLEQQDMKIEKGGGKEWRGECSR